VKLVDEATYRVWRLYMAGSAYYFEQGSTDMFQVLIGHASAFLSIPLHQQNLYNEGAGQPG